MALPLYMYVYVYIYIYIYRVEPLTLMSQVWAYMAPAQQLEAAPLVAAARWHCHQWEAMEGVTRLIPVRTIKFNNS